MANEPVEAGGRNSAMSNGPLDPSSRSDGGPSLLLILIVLAAVCAIVGIGYSIYTVAFREDASSASLTDMDETATGSVTPTDAGSERAPAPTEPAR